MRKLRRLRTYLGDDHQTLLIEIQSSSIYGIPDGVQLGSKVEKVFSMTKTGW
jgi:hypothetical protein